MLIAVILAAKSRLPWETVIRMGECGPWHDASPVEITVATAFLTSCPHYIMCTEALPEPPPATDKSCSSSAHNPALLKQLDIQFLCSQSHKLNQEQSTILTTHKHPHPPTPTTMSATINEDAVKSVSNQEGQVGSHVPPSEPLEKGGVSSSRVQSIHLHHR